MKYLVKYNTTYKVKNNYYKKNVYSLLQICVQLSVWLA